LKMHVKELLALKGRRWTMVAMARWLMPMRSKLTSPLL